MKKEIILGVTNCNDVVRANIKCIRGQFSISFDVLAPVVVSGEVLRGRTEGFIECMEDGWKYEQCCKYDCKPSNLLDEILSDSEIEDIITDIDFTYDVFNVQGVENDIYFELIGGGQTDIRGTLIPINKNFSAQLFHWWDSYHLSNIDEVQWQKILEAICTYEGSFDETEYLQGFLNSFFNVPTHTTLKEVIENLKTVKEKYDDDLYNSIVSAFSDYQYGGVSEVIVSSKGKNHFELVLGWHTAYVNHKDAPIINFRIVQDGEFYKIANAYIKE